MLENQAEVRSGFFFHVKKFELCYQGKDIEEFQIRDNKEICSFERPEVLEDS